MKSMRIIILSLFTLGLVFFTGCGGTDRNTGTNSVEEVGKGTYVKAEVLDEVNASVMLPFAQAVAAKTGETRDFAFGFKAYKITYNTTNENNEKVKASGLLMIPEATTEYNKARIENGESPFSVSMLFDHHGTIFLDSEAPTNILNISADIPAYFTTLTSQEQLYATMVAYAGFALIAPDYIGYGESNTTYHPYLLKKASAQSSLDMLQASIKYMNDQKVLLNNQLYISGYSQGGHGAMALAEEVVNNFSDSVALKAVAPMAAPLNIKEFADATFNAGYMPVPAFMAHIAEAYATYNENLTLAELIDANKTASFTNLFDKTNNDIEIHTQLGLAPGALVTSLFDSTFVSNYISSSEHKLKTIFTANNVDSLKTDIPIHLIHCTNDPIINVDFSKNGQATLEQAGSTNIKFTELDDTLAVYDINASLVHQECASPAYSTAIKYFDSIRQGE